MARRYGQQLSAMFFLTHGVQIAHQMTIVATSMVAVVKRKLLKLLKHFKRICVGIRVTAERMFTARTGHKAQWSEAEYHSRRSVACQWPPMGFIEPPPLAETRARPIQIAKTYYHKRFLSSKCRKMRLRHTAPDARFMERGKWRQTGLCKSPAGKINMYSI